jgi:hypothetical protein
MSDIICPATSLFEDVFICPTASLFEDAFHLRAKGVHNDKPISRNIAAPRIMPISSPIQKVQRRLHLLSFCIGTYFLAF